MPEVPNFHAGVMLALTAIALYLFSRDRIMLETSSFAILVFIVVFFELFPFEANDIKITSRDFFYGFGHEALIAVTTLMICGQGLVATGALLPAGRTIARLWRFAPRTSLLLTLFIGAFFSAFVNNTPVVVLLIPVLANVASRNGESAAPWLMPMNFATMLGGTSTTIGTSTNLLVVAIAVDLGLRQIGLFDLILPAAAAGLIGIIYLWLIAPNLLAKHDAGHSESVDRDFIFQIAFPEGSTAVGQSIGELQTASDGVLTILRLRRAENNFSAPLPDARIRENDRITCRATADQMHELESMLDGQLVGDNNDEKIEEDIEIAQIVVMENSSLVNSTVADARFASTYELEIVAIHRATATIRSIPGGVKNMKLKTGDVLLVQGAREAIENLKSDRSILLLDARKAVPASNRAWLAICILVAVVLAAAFGILPIAVSALAGAFLMLLCRCINWRDIGQALSIPVVMIVVVSLALGSALTKTGASEYLAQLFLYYLSGASPNMILAALLVLMAIFTNIVSNNAAAVIGTPIAISLADKLGAPPEAFVMAVLFGANLSFVTPMAYKTNLLVMSAGDYSFSDFVKVGLPLTIILCVMYSFLLPYFFGI